MKNLKKLISTFLLCIFISSVTNASLYVGLQGNYEDVKGYNDKKHYCNDYPAYLLKYTCKISPKFIIGGTLKLLCDEYWYGINGHTYGADVTIKIVPQLYTLFKFRETHYRSSKKVHDNEQHYNRICNNQSKITATIMYKLPIGI
jgi:hypothetical protein